ncbi:MAG: glycoside hydrolase [Planctomycetes bacterium]|nr:glycoside hydrolase [Planctomycetota bacterium]
MRLPLVALVLLLSAARAPAAPQQPGPRAQWIGVELGEAARSPRNQWLAFRGSATLDEVPRPALARIATDSHYWLWVNGELAVFEGELKRGPTPQDTYCDEVDLAPWLKPGANEVAVLVWHFGRRGYGHKPSGRAGLFLELAGTPLATDAAWRARVHPAYGDCEPFEPAPNYRLPESNVRYDARRELAGWTAPGYDDAAWPAALALGAPPCAPWNALVRRPTPQLRRSDVRDYVAVEARDFGKQRLVRATLPYNTTVHPFLEVRAPAGRVVDVSTDDYKGGGEYNVRLQYVTRAGAQAWYGLPYLSGHEVRYFLPADVEVVRLGYVETRYDTDEAGAFDCPDDALLALRAEALTTLRLNLRDAIQDPDRERAQWWGDVVNVLPQLFTTLDERAHPLAAKAVRELFAWQRADGSLFSPVPTGLWNRELPLQMLAAVGEYGVARYVLYTGDVELLREVWPRLVRYLDLWQLDEDGLVVRRPGEWTWVDWGANKDVPLEYDAWFHLALRGAERMATWVGDDERRARYAALRVRHAAAFRARYAHDGVFRSPDHAGPPDDRGNALAVLAELHAPAEVPALEALLLRERAASPYLERFVLEALFELGDGTSALQRLRERYAPMLADDATTLWERWDLDPRRSSYNHAWSGAPLSLCSEQVAGVTPLEPGYAHLRVRPRPGALQRASATVPTPHGPVHVAFDRATTPQRLEVELPDGTLAEVSLPPGDYARVTLDGADVPPAASWPLGPGRHVLTAE